MKFESFRMDEMMKGQRGWRELTELGDKGNKISGMLEGIIWSPKGGDPDKLRDDWDTEEVKYPFCFPSRNITFLVRENSSHYVF